MNQDSLWCHFSVPNGTSNCVHHLFPMQQNLARCYISWAWQNILLPSSERNIKEEQNWGIFWIRLLHRIVHRLTFESDWSRARTIQQAVNWIFKSRFLLICQLCSRVGSSDTSVCKYIIFQNYTTRFRYKRKWRMRKLFNWPWYFLTLQQHGSCCLFLKCPFKGQNATFCN